MSVLTGVRQFRIDVCVSIGMNQDVKEMNNTIFEGIYGEFQILVKRIETLEDFVDFVFFYQHESIINVMNVKLNCAISD